MNSKKIGKADDSAKEFIIDLLDGDETKGFDFDSIYYTNKGWIIIEFLKCESKYVDPHTSDPKKYPWNWKKFHSLYQASKDLNGQLWLVNFGEGDYKDKVRLMVVKDFDYDKIRNYTSTKDRYKNLEYLYFEEDRLLSFAEFQEIFRKLNATATLPPLL